MALNQRLFVVCNSKCYPAIRSRVLNLPVWGILMKRCWQFMKLPGLKKIRYTEPTGMFLPEHKIFYFLFIFIFSFQIKHCTEYPVPDGSADTITPMCIFVMMQVMIAPKRFHPFKRRVPGVDGIVHATVH